MIASLTKRELEEQITALFQRSDPALDGWPFDEARRIRQRHYANRVYLRGLIEFTSHCRQDCYYCGLRRSNPNAARYRLDREQILACCHTGYQLGFRSFVLQGGEDGAFTDKVLCEIVSAIKERYPDCAVTLSLGERSTASYRALWSAGADRYLLRHETADPHHYARLHPPEQTLEARKACLYALREIGFQTGAGFMVGSPEQTVEHLAADLLFLKDLQPHMVGIGPFVPHRDTPFGKEPAGTLEQTLVMLALTRLLLPQTLLPATTALATIHPHGRELGLRSGANVIMPNLSPSDVRAQYLLYNDKASAGSEAAESLGRIQRELEAAGFAPDLSRGDHCAISVK